MNKIDVKDIKQTLKDAFAAYWNMDAYDLRIVTTDRGISFQGDCKLIHGIVKEKGNENEKAE